MSDPEKGVETGEEVTLALTDNQEGALLETMLSRPEKVAIVALGGSSATFFHEMIQSTRKEKWVDEVWSLNRGLRGVQHDKLFCMDDLKWLEEKDPNYAAYLKKHNVPIITSTAYSDYPMAVEYPIHEVLQHVKTDVFAVNTVSYMLAYALYIGVKEVWVYGADFIYPNGNQAEKGGQAVAFLLGLFHAAGLEYHVPATSTLLYANEIKPRPGGMPQRVFYGYHRKKKDAPTTG